MKDSQDRVLVLLATFNGSSYINEQLQSIAYQSYKKVDVILSDDCSEDNTLETVKNFSNDMVRIIVRNPLNNSLKGHVANFDFLCQKALKSQEKYFCFSDQDDVWHADKLLKMQNKMKKLELVYGSETPILIHSDLRVVDSELKEIAPSFFEFQGLPDPEKHDFPRFFFQNVVTGCTTFFNRALLEIAAPIPEQVIVHDWWFAQCAKLFGVLAYIDEPLVDYRQHSDNAIGAKSHKEQNSFFNRHLYQALIKFPSHLSKSIAQANALLANTEYCQRKIPLHYKKQLEEFARLKSLSLFQRTKWAEIAMNNPSGFTEKWYFRLAFIIVKWIK